MQRARQEQPGELWEQQGLGLQQRQGRVAARVWIREVTWGWTLGWLWHLLERDGGSWHFWYEHWDQQLWLKGSILLLHWEWTKGSRTEQGDQLEGYCQHSGKKCCWLGSEQKQKREWDVVHVGMYSEGKFNMICWEAGWRVWEKERTQKWRWGFGLSHGIDVVPIQIVAELGKTAGGGQGGKIRSCALNIKVWVPSVLKTSSDTSLAYYIQ